MTRVKKKKKEKRLRLFKCGYVNQRAGMFSDCIETAKRQKQQQQQQYTDFHSGTVPFSRVLRMV